jgi:hypothetical protein
MARIWRDRVPQDAAGSASLNRSVIEGGSFWFYVLQKALPVANGMI